MSSDYSPRSGGSRSARPRRRGGRSSSSSSRPSGGRPPRSGERREGDSPAQGEPKKGFFDKIKGLFGLGKKKSENAERPAASGERSQHPTLRRAEEQRQDRPARTERTERQPERTERPERAERSEQRSERPARPAAPRPELEEANPDAVVVPRLYVGNLSYDTVESDLFDLFSKVGSVRSVELVMDRRSNRSKGFGFVDMGDLDVAKKAVVAIHKTEFMGRQLVVSGAKSERRETSAPVEPQQELPPVE